MIKTIYFLFVFILILYNSFLYSFTFQSGQATSVYVLLFSLLISTITHIPLFFVPTLKAQRWPYRLAAAAAILFCSIYHFNAPMQYEYITLFDVRRSDTGTMIVILWQLAVRGFYLALILKLLIPYFNNVEAQ